MLKPGNTIFQIQILFACSLFLKIEWSGRNAVGNPPPIITPIRIPIIIPILIIIRTHTILTTIPIAAIGGNAGFTSIRSRR